MVILKLDLDPTSQKARIRNKFKMIRDEANNREHAHLMPQPMGWNITDDLESGRFLKSMCYKTMTQNGSNTAARNCISREIFVAIRAMDKGLFLAPDVFAIRRIAQFFKKNEKYLAVVTLSQFWLHIFVRNCNKLHFYIVSKSF